MLRRPFRERSGNTDVFPNAVEAVGRRRCVPALLFSWRFSNGSDFSRARATPAERPR
jgi:hypothetical protein